MSDSASRDDITSLGTISQTEKMEKEATASTAIVAVAAAAQYPSNRKRIIIMTALYLAVFLVTLVRPAPFLDSNSPPCRLIAYLNCRTKTSYQQRFHGSRMSSIRWMTLDGTALHICLPCVAFNCSWVKYTNSTQPSQSSSPVYRFLRLVRRSAGQPPAQKLSLLVEPLQDWDLLAYFQG